jgi:hypothetical protein
MSRGGRGGLGAWWLGDPLSVYVRIQNRTYSYDEFKALILSLGVEYERSKNRIYDNENWVADLEYTFNTLRFPLKVYRGLNMRLGVTPKAGLVSRGGYAHNPFDEQGNGGPAWWTWSKEVAEYFACGCHISATDRENGIPWVLTMRIAYPSAIDWDDAVRSYVQYSFHSTAHPWTREDEVTVNDLDAITDLGAHQMTRQRCKTLCDRMYLVAPHWRA